MIKPNLVEADVVKSLQGLESIWAKKKVKKDSHPKTSLRKIKIMDFSLEVERFLPLHKIRLQNHLPGPDLKTALA